MKMVWCVGNGSRVRFLHDVWPGECPLKIMYPSLFKLICSKIGLWLIYGKNRFYILEEA